MNNFAGRKKPLQKSPAYSSQDRKPLSGQANPNVQKTGLNGTPLHHHSGQRLGKENQDADRACGAASSPGPGCSQGRETGTFKTPTRLAPAAKPQGTPECYTKVEMCAPTPGRLSRPSYTGELDNDGFSVMVAVRVRPFCRREEADSDVTCVVSMSGNETTVVSGRGAGVNSFCFDHCFWSFDAKSATFSDQQSVYEKVGQPLLHSALEGYHTCLFAYGQTGSGKSYTMMGDSEAKGVIPRFCEELFMRISNPEEENVTYKVEVSFFEIYNEKIHDLLSNTSDKDQKKATLRVREHPSLGPYVEGLSIYPVKTFSDISRWIRTGNGQRATASTMMNDASSRSHSVFLIVLTRSKTEHFEDGEHVNSTVSKINLIDLAGSERSSTAQTSGDRLKEGANINKSLLTLGKVISNLSEKSLNPKKKAFIPYRESVLTWLLKESLGGNSKTAMIATVSPASTNVEETMSTLRYAKQAESIINIPKVNEDPNARLVRELRAEIERLRLISKGSYSKQQDLDRVKNSAPNLINIDENPQHDETLLYLLKGGKNRIASTASSSEDSGSSDDNDQYCVVENANKLYCVKPGSAQQTMVNGREVRRQTFLNHGDRLIVGNSYYRFNHPEEVRRKRKRKTTSQSDHVAGFKYAKNEIIEEQKKRMEVEVNNAKKELISEMEKRIKSIKESAAKEANERNVQAENQIKKLTSAADKYDEQLQQVKNERNDLAKEKSELRQQLMNVRNMVRKTLLPGVEEQCSKQPGHQQQQSQLLDLLETEKDRLRERIRSTPRKRASCRISDAPVTKKYRNDNECHQHRSSSVPSFPSPSIQGACLRHLSLSSTPTSVQSPNMIDSILAEMGRTMQLMNWLKDDRDTTKSHDATFLELTSSCDITVTLLTVFCNMHSSGRDSLANTVKDIASKLKVQLGQFLESLNGQNDNDPLSHYSRFTQNTLLICKLIGELNARIGKSVLILRKEEDEGCDWSLRQAIVTGGEMAVDQELQGGLQEMADSIRGIEQKMKSHGSKESELLEGARLLAKSFAILLNKCQETQFELGSVLAGEERRASSFYLQSYERALSLVGNIRQGLHEIGEIVRLLAGSSNGENVTQSLLNHVSGLHTPVSTIGLSTATLDLLPSQSSVSSMESTTSSTSSTSSDQNYRPSDLAMLASRQVLAAADSLQRFLRGSTGNRQSGDSTDEVFSNGEARHVRFEDPTSKDVLLVTKYSYNHSCNSTG